MAALGKQENFAVNVNKSQVYIEDSTTPLSFNYKTNQWSTITDYAGIGFYSVDSGVNVGLARVSGTAVDLQQPDTSDPTSIATLTTGEAAFNDGSRRMITGVRPLIVGADGKVSVIYRQSLNPGDRTNYMLYSQDFSNAAWSKTTTNISLAAFEAPDGTITANNAENSADPGNPTISQTSQDHGGLNNVVLSCFFKANTCTDVDFGPGVATGTARMHVNLTTGEVVSVDSHSSIVAYGVETHGNSFFRPWIVVTPEASTTGMQIKLVDTDGTSPCAQGDSIYLWGAMLSTGNYPTTYISTEASTSTATTETSAESKTVNSRTGMAPFRIEGRYHRIKVRVDETFDTILGADVEYSPTGEA